MFYGLEPPPLRATDLERRLVLDGPWIRWFEKLDKALRGTVYKDDNFAAVALGTGATPPDLISLNGGTVYVRGFAGSGGTAEQLFGGMEINHDYQSNSDIIPHLHWCPTTTNAGNVKWQLAYQWVSNGEVCSSETIIDVTVAASGVAWKMERVSFPAISGVGKSYGSQLMIRLFRNPADAADTYPDDAAIVGTFGVHYIIDTLGSREISGK